MSSDSKYKSEEKCDKSDIVCKTLVEIFFLEIPFSIPRRRAGKISETNGLLKIILIFKSLNAYHGPQTMSKERQQASLWIIHASSCKMGESCTGSSKTVFSHPLGGFKSIKAAGLITKLMRLRIHTIYNAKMPKAQSVMGNWNEFTIRPNCTFFIGRVM